MNGSISETASPWGWLLALSLSLGAAAVIGLARFSYGLMLPSMQADLHWTYSEAGGLGAANALGYLAGAIITMRSVQRLGNRVLFAGGLAVTAFALLASGLTPVYAWQLAWRAVAGFGAAGTFVCGGVLAGTLNLSLAGRMRPGLGVTVFFAGGGLGVLLSGATLPLWFAARGDAAWPIAWIAMGVATLLATACATLAVRQVEEPNAANPAGTNRVGTRWPIGHYRAALTGYFLFGLGYIAYMTFIVAWMRRLGADAPVVATTWAVLGAATIVAPLFWGERFRRSRGGRSMAEALVLFALGAMLPLVLPGHLALLASAALVGGSIFMVPAAVTLLVRNELPRAAWGGAVAAFTLLFAIGQVLGPMMAGALADLTGSLMAGLATSAALLLAGAGCACLQRPATAAA